LTAFRVTYRGQYIRSSQGSGEEKASLVNAKVEVFNGAGWKRR